MLNSTTPCRRTELRLILLYSPSKRRILEAGIWGRPISALPVTGKARIARQSRRPSKPGGLGVWDSLRLCAPSRLVTSALPSRDIFLFISKFSHVPSVASCCHLPQGWSFPPFLSMKRHNESLLRSHELMNSHHIPKFLSFLPHIRHNSLTPSPRTRLQIFLHVSFTLIQSHRIIYI